MFVSLCFLWHDYWLAVAEDIPYCFHDVEDVPVKMWLYRKNTNYFWTAWPTICFPASLPRLVCNQVHRRNKQKRLLPVNCGSRLCAGIRLSKLTDDLLTLRYPAKCSWHTHTKRLVALTRVRAVEGAERSEVITLHLLALSRVSTAILWHSQGLVLDRKTRRDWSVAW